jgi:hypothetical protein
MPTLEDNLRPNTLKRVFEDWAANPEYLNDCVDFEGLEAQLNDLCVACSVAAAHVYGLTTGRYIHRSVVPQEPSDLPASCDIFISYAAEDRLVAQALAVEADGRVAFDAVGPANRTWTVQASGELLDWIPMAELPATNATARLIDPDAPKYKHRFYRGWAW